MDGFGSEGDSKWARGRFVVNDANARTLGKELVSTHDDHLSSSAESVRLAVYRCFARTGRAPAIDDLATGTTMPVGEIRHQLGRLHENRHLVVDARDPDRILMAHPFSAVPLGFSVMGRSTLWWGGCAWDSFAIPHLLTGEPDVLVATRCPGCDAANSWTVGRDVPPSGDQVAHFLTPVHRMWDDVVHTCANQRLFCTTGCVDDWLARTGHTRGYVMDLATLWRLARGWYSGRMTPGYTRREPAEAAAYLAEAGLAGSFWGLPEASG